MLIFIVILAVAAYVIFRFLSRGGSKEKTAHVRVLGKESRPHKAQGKEDDSLPTDLIVRFSANGKELEMQVSRSMFETAREGDEGTLTYKGSVFVDFEPDNRKPW